MKTFRRIQVGVAAVASCVAAAVSNSNEATQKEILVSVVLATLALMVIVGVLIERGKEEAKCLD